MSELFADFHWKTFFLSVVIFFILTNFWSIFATYMARKKAKRRVEIVDKAYQETMAKLKEKDQELAALFEKLKEQGKP